MKNIFIIICLGLLLISCKERKKSELEKYGNTFSYIPIFHFDIPDNWVKYDLMDSAFSIQIPPYMRETIWDGMNIIDKDKGITFCYNDSTLEDEHYYGRVAIDYVTASKGTFSKPEDNLLTGETIDILEKIVDDEIKDRSQILNGPIFDCKSTNQHYFLNHEPCSTHYLDIFYRRKSVTNSCPVSVHIFFLQNDDKMVKMMISFHDKDSMIFSDLFKIIKTFEWN